MFFDPNPLSQQLHLKELETKYLARNFDHSKPPLTGWRAEHQQVEFSKQTPTPKNKIASEAIGAGPKIGWIAPLKRFWFRVPVAN